MLFLVPTPIGNLGDMSQRAIDILQNADIILAEDTRTSKVLLNHYHISTVIRSNHSHNEHMLTAQWIEMMKSGKILALISDAGTPGISDPGFLLVRACYEEGIKVSALPGPSAIIPALAMSGIPCDRFYFEGFLPHKKGRNKRWEYLKSIDSTIVLYESPYRLEKLIGEILIHLGDDRLIAVVKEISKIHEAVFRGSALNILSELKEQKAIKGEFVVIIGTVTN